MSDTIQARGISPTAAVEHAVKLLDTDPAAAEIQAREILKVLPHDSRAILIVGSARRRMGDAAVALSILEPLAAAVPDSADVHHELGLTLARLGESAAAIAELRRATELQGEMPHAWLALTDQLTMAGDSQGAATAYAEHIRTSLKDPELRAAAAALRDGRLKDAEKTLRRHLAKHPGDISALRMMGEIAARLGQLDVAAEILGRCVELAPAFVGARYTYAMVLHQNNRAADAIEHAEMLLADAPREPKYLILLAACLGFVGEFDRALEVMRQVLADYPNQPKIWVNYGQILRVTGRLDESVAAYRRVLELNPAMGEAYWSLADLKTVRLTEDDMEAARGQLASDALAPADRVHINYALGKALEDAGDWAGSFAHYAEGAKVHRQLQPYDADQTTAFAQICKATFTREYFQARAEGDWGSPDPAPIFIVGLPRSGTTLIEQILGSHSLVEATMELPEITVISGRVVGSSGKPKGAGYPAATALLTASQSRELGEAYLSRTRRYRKTEAPYFLDKAPNNFHHLGLIRTILPDAKIIDVRRHPMASGFATFKQHFFHGQNFTYDLSDVARYYRDYVVLMAHFDEVLPGFVHRVIYEDLIEDTEKEIRRLLDYCRLPFEESCLRFWETRRSVSTHSSEQVRQPIFRDGLDLWRRYEPWLGELREALGPLEEAWRDPPAA